MSTRISAKHLRAFEAGIKKLASFLKDLESVRSSLNSDRTEETSQQQLRQDVRRLRKLLSYEDVYDFERGLEDAVGEHRFTFICKELARLRKEETGKRYETPGGAINEYPSWCPSAFSFAQDLWYSVDCTFDNCSNYLGFDDLYRTKILPKHVIALHARLLATPEIFSDEIIGDIRFEFGLLKRCEGPGLVDTGGGEIMPL